jgi:O-antigen/teichoic acid export membrane protein
MLAALRSKTGQNTQLVFGGEILGVIIGFAGNLVLMRNMTVGDYGLYSLFLSSMMMIAGFMHFGWIDTYVRYGSKFFQKEEFAYIRRICLKKVSSGAALAIVVVALLSPWLSDKILKREQMELFLIASAIGGAINILFSFSQNDYRVHHRFSALINTKVGSGLFRLFAYLLFVPLQMIIPLFWAILLNLLSLFLFCGEFLWRLGRQFARQPKIQEYPAIKKEMESYNFWILISFLSTTVIGNIDLFILSHFHPNQTLGSFGAAVRLTLPFQILISALTTALLPRLHQVTNPADMRFYLRKITLFLIPTALLLLALVLFAPPALIWIAGPAYSEIGTLLRLQLITTMVMVLANPYGLVLHAWGWSKFFALLNLFQLVLDIILDLLWIPKFGAEGAVAATLVINLVGLVAIYIGLWSGFKKHPWVQ